MSLITDALDEWLTEKPHRKRRLRYSTDLAPSTCHRRIWYELHGTEAKPPSLPTKLLFEAGRRVERMVVEALSEQGKVVGTQAKLAPTRPSAWCWASMHADLVLEGGTLVEVKSARSQAFDRARTRDGRIDPLRLVKESHVWQTSAYLHEAREEGVAERALLLYLDRDGSHAPVEIEVSAENGLLVPLEAIVVEEERKAYLLTAKEPPASLPRETSVSIWKTKPPRVWGALNWQCVYDCPFRPTCAPGPDVTELDPAAHAHLVATAQLAADAHWQAGSKSSPFTMSFECDPGSVPEPATKDSSTHEKQGVES
jgi:hypothetical protein